MLNWREWFAMAAPRAFSLSSRSAHESVSHLQCTRRNKPAASWSQQSKGTWNLEQLMNPDNEWVTSTQLRSRYGSIYHFCTVYSIRRRPSLLIPRPLLLNFFFFSSHSLGTLYKTMEKEKPWSLIWIRLLCTLIQSSNLQDCSAFFWQLFIYLSTWETNDSRVLSVRGSRHALSI